MSKIEPIKVPSEVEELMAAEPAENQLNFIMQKANIRVANALTALAIHSGAMTPDGEFIEPAEIPPVGTLEESIIAKEVIQEKESNLESKSEDVSGDGEN